MFAALALSYLDAADKGGAAGAALAATAAIANESRGVRGDAADRRHKRAAGGAMLPPGTRGVIFDSAPAHVDATVAAR